MKPGHRKGVSVGGGDPLALPIPALGPATIDTDGEFEMRKGLGERSQGTFTFYL